MAQLNHFDVNRSAKPMEWHVEDLIPNGICVFAGHPGSAKSLLAEYLSWCTAYEQPCLGCTTRYGPALYINNDHPEDMHNQWLQRFCEGHWIGYPPVHPLVTIHHQWSNLEKSQVEVEETLCRLKPVLMVIDRLSTTMGANENKSENVEPFGELLRHLADTYDITIILIHHLTKEPIHLNLKEMESTFINRLRGSGSILGMTDSAMELVTTEKDDKKLKEFGVRPHPKRAVVLPPFRAGVIESGQGVTLEFRQGWQPVSLELLQLADKVFPLFDSGEVLTVKSVDTNFAGAYDIRELREVLKYMESKGLLKSDRIGKGGHYVYKKAV